MEDLGRRAEATRHLEAISVSVGEASNLIARVIRRSAASIKTRPFRSRCRRTRHRDSSRFDRACDRWRDKRPSKLSGIVRNIRLHDSTSINAVTPVLDPVDQAAEHGLLHSCAPGWPAPREPAMAFGARVMSDVNVSQIWRQALFCPRLRDLRRNHT